MNSTARSLVVWGTTSAVAVPFVTWLLPEPTGGHDVGSGGFTTWLVHGCSLAAAGCVAWLWVLVTVVVVEALRGRTVRAGVPAGVRRIVLAACGLSLAGGLVVPASADPPAPPPEPGSGPALLVGLPLPDRTTTTTEWVGALGTRAAPLADTPRRDVPDRDTVRVRPGDTLWGIARDSLPPAAGDDEIDRRWRAIHRANLDVVGADPDLIHPGQRLRMPPSEGQPR